MQCKRILCALLASLMILPLAACGNTEEDTGTSTSTVTPLPMRKPVKRQRQRSICPRSGSTTLN